MAPWQRDRPLRQGFQAEFAHFPLAAFALQRNGAGGDVAVLGFVHQLAVDKVFDRIAAADNFISVPFAGRFLIGRDGRFGDPQCPRFMPLAGRAAHQDEVALALIPALILDALGPDLVRPLHMDENAGVVGLGRDFHEPPFRHELVVAEIFIGADVTEWLAGAVDDAIGYGKGICRSRVASQKKCPAGKILAVKKIHAARRRDWPGWLGGEGIGDGDQGGQQTNGAQNREVFHARSLSPPDKSVKNSCRVLE